MTEVQIQLIQFLYRARMLRESDSVGLREWADERGFPREEAERGFYELHEAQILNHYASGFHVEITLFGLQFAEQHGLADPAIHAESDRIQIGILLSLAELREEKGLHHYNDIHALARELETSVYSTHIALERLELGGFVEPLGAGGHYKITPGGVAALQAIKARQSIETTYKSLLSSTNPHGRGHEIEKLLAQVAEREGWSATLNVRSVGEENDIVLSAAREAWLVSCKWLSGPAEADDLNSLEAKLRRRPGAHGILVSMGGFTSGLVRLAEETRDAIVVLFGKGDVEAMIYGETSFEELLTHRWKALIERRKAEFDIGS